MGETAFGAPGQTASSSGSCEVRLTQHKGYSTFARAPHAQGACILQDDPLFVMQHTGNRRVVVACANCCAFIGSVSSQVEAIFNEERFAPLMAQVGSMVRGWEQSLASSGHTISRGVACSQGCGEIYCSETCRAAHFAHSHNLLCVGPLTDESHPLIQFKYHAIEHADTLLLAAHAIAHLLNRICACGGGADVARRFQAELLCFVHAPFKDACRPPPGRAKDDEFLRVTDGILQQASSLLRQALEPHAPLEVQTLFEAGPAFLSELLGMFEYNNMDVEIASPLGPFFIERAQALHDAMTRGCAESGLQLQLMEKLLREKEWVMRCVWGPETTGIYNGDVELENAAVLVPPGQGEVASNSPQDDDDTAMTGIAMAEARQLADRMNLEELLQAPWPKVHGIALFSTVSRINHSCMPNVKVVFPDNGAKLSLFALAPLALGDELSISYIDQNTDLKSRRDQLVDDYGFVCDCERCLREDSSGGRRANKRLK